jgi:hypothetical protein
METGTVFMPLLAALLVLTFFKSHVGLPAIVSEYQGHTGNSGHSWVFVLGNKLQ